MSSLFTTYQLYTPDEADKVLANLPADLWTKGNARTPELTNLVKHNEEFLPGANEAATEILKNHARSLAENVSVKTTHMLKGVSPAKFNRYAAPGQEYRRHTDAPVMSGIRTDLACTTAFSDPDSYEGGELNIEDQYGNVHTIKPKKGEAVMYACGAPHWVSPVTEGERVSIICWVQSYIRDMHKRSILANMLHSVQKLEPLSFEDDLIREVWTDLGAAHAALFKMWIE